MKAKSNSKIDSLPQNQREAISAWLFDENLSYAATQKLMAENFQVLCAISSLSAWYQRQNLSRQLLQIAQATKRGNRASEMRAAAVALLKASELSKIMRDGSLSIDDKISRAHELIFNFDPDKKQ